MALAATTLSGAATATSNQIKVTTGTSITVGMFLQVDNEWMKVADVTNQPTLLVVRGVLQSDAIAHGTLTPVVYGIPSDFTQSQYQPVAGPITPQTIMPIVAYGAAGAITVPVVDTYISLKSGASSAMTLNDPALDNNALVIIQAADAKAYTVDNGSTNNTSGSGFNGGGTPSDVGTFGGAIGDNCIIRANQGKWLVINLRNVTLG